MFSKGYELDKPIQHAEAVMNPETKQLEIKLDKIPGSNGFETEIDLDEVKEISVSSPDTIWFYQKKEHSRRQEYVEVVVVTKSNTKSYHLVDRKTRIYCDGIDTAGPQEKRGPIEAVKTLTIESFSCRTEQKNTAPCPPREKK